MGAHAETGALIGERDARCRARRTTLLQPRLAGTEAEAAPASVSASASASPKIRKSADQVT
jgi:hypothetical protein